MRQDTKTRIFLHVSLLMVITALQEILIEHSGDAIEEEYDCKVSIQSHPSISPYLFPDQRIRYGTVTNGPDKWGFFTLESDWDETSLCCVGNKTELPSLYKGKLF